MSVPKPWMVSDPAPSMSHSLGGLPALEFSHRMGLAIGASHGPAAKIGAVGSGSGRSGRTAPIAISKTIAQPPRRRLDRRRLRLSTGFLTSDCPLVPVGLRAVRNRRILRLLGELHRGPPADSA